VNASKGSEKESPRNDLGLETTMNQKVIRVTTPNTLKTVYHGDAVESTEKTVG
jgi:hypothetical protein